MKVEKFYLTTQKYKIVCESCGNISYIRKVYFDKFGKVCSRCGEPEPVKKPRKPRKSKAKKVSKKEADTEIIEKEITIDNVEYELINNDMTE